MTGLQTKCNDIFSISGALRQRYIDMLQYGDLLLMA